jgi:DNA mismatch endonuclease (patch repair protein)
MADRLTPEKRSWNMSRIRQRDTRPELLVRSYLHRIGLRFRIGDASLPGRPDIVLASLRTVVFVHGCYWHRHRGCSLATTPDSNRSFWLTKFQQNVERDTRNFQALRDLGWQPLIIWECEIPMFGELDSLALQLLARRDDLLRAARSPLD